MISINQPAPEFKEKALIGESIKEISLKDYLGKWVILFFYPADFTFVCPTELKELTEIHEKIKQLNAEIISISTDTFYVHKAWKESSETINKIKFPMVADPARRIVTAYNTLNQEEGTSIRATFLINPEGTIKAIECQDDDMGRSSQEILRKLQAAKYTAENPGQLCPMNWTPGGKTIQKQE